MRRKDTVAAHTPRMVRPTALGRTVSPRTLAWLLLGGFALVTAGLLRPSQLRAAGGYDANAVRVQDNPATPNSGPIAISPDDRFVWMVSPDDNPGQVTVVRVEG